MVKYEELTHEDKLSALDEVFEVMNPTELEQINALCGQLLIEVLQDIRIRVGDWMAGGGDADDPYIHQQLRYARKFVKE